MNINNFESKETLALNFNAGGNSPPVIPYRVSGRGIAAPQMEKQLFNTGNNYSQSSTKIPD
ncbi:hypothetical protein [Aerosakkonema funiforme]|uniref:Uncharacterized protein n=1 Tax=Aerosakkonema funiforme FACHB-1375 TaxID=2949571 RepID=A0A926ZFU3_9CYAN|nr:hypothetical protein [Aerosakkonema funiforme]MBD2181493.1 hypothetical protein [Aerosakkonema funiforme FACHB-1375]